MMMSVTVESGGTFSARSAFAASAAKVGAATLPPVCSGPLGSSIITAMTKRGFDIGAMPTKLPT
jgi:hypothetical protein